RHHLYPLHDALPISLIDQEEKKLKRSKYLQNGVFTDRKFYRPMLNLAVPVIIQNFIGSFLNMVDTVMVGRLGETSIAAVGIANQDRKSTLHNSITGK